MRNIEEPVLWRKQNESASPFLTVKLTGLESGAACTADVLDALYNTVFLLIERVFMSIHASPHRSVIANAVYGVLNPIPFGFFVAALTFDILYLRTTVIQWDKAAAWLIVIGLLFAVIPRLVSLAQVWITSRHNAQRADKIDFWLNLVAIIAAIFNAFVHSRDAYASMPTGAWLSAFTVILLAVGRIGVAVQSTSEGELVHE